VDDVSPKLLKIIALAKQGVGGERDTAIALVRQICERESLDFDAVMSDSGDMPKLYEPDIKVRGKDELRIAIQVASRFATTPEHPGVRGGYYGGSYREIWLAYTTTAARHIDTLNAIEVYLRAYRREKKKFQLSLQKAFYAHHSLYPQFDTEDDDQPPKVKTLEERQSDLRAATMMMGMTEQVKIQKQLGGGDENQK